MVTSTQGDENRGGAGDGARDDPSTGIFRVLICFSVGVVDLSLAESRH